MLSKIFFIGAYSSFVSEKADIIPIKICVGIKINSTIKEKVYRLKTYSKNTENFKLSKTNALKDGKLSSLPVYLNKIAIPEKINHIIESSTKKNPIN